MKLILSGKINGIIGFSHVLYESTGYRMISSVLLFECYIHFRAIWRHDEWRNKSVRGSSRDARGAASEHSHSQSSGEVRIGEQAGPRLGEPSQPSVSLSFNPDSKTLEWGETLWTKKSVLCGTFELDATGNYGRRNLGYNLREILHVL